MNTVSTNVLICSFISSALTSRSSFFRRTLLASLCAAIASATATSVAAKTTASVTIIPQTETIKITTLSHFICRSARHFPSLPSCAPLAFVSPSSRKCSMSPPFSTFSSDMSASISRGIPAKDSLASGNSTLSSTIPSTTSPSLFTSSNPEVAKRVSASPTSLHQCGARLRSGHLVSFPTETVYGLGCHALDPTAVQKVFDAKERPLSDPLIVHVNNAEDALELWAASSTPSEPSQQPPQSRPKESPHSKKFPQSSSSKQSLQNQIEKQALHLLTTTFFPGPLTLVARANPQIPQILMANTGYVACRSPSHPVARALILAAGVPIAAPSANKFGHVSPTRAGHVMDDLGREDVWVVDPGCGDGDCVRVDDAYEVGGEGIVDGEDGVVCQVGVESTVAKVEMEPPGTSNDNNEVRGIITILRHGAVSSQSIQEALHAVGLSKYFQVSDLNQYTSEKVHHVAPGQTIKHYSPNVPCFMIDPSRQQHNQLNVDDLSEVERWVLSQAVIIDYGGRLSHYQSYAMAYRDLSPSGNGTEAASTVFQILRWSEGIEGAKRVFVPEIEETVKEGDEMKDSGGGERGGMPGQALVMAVRDKLRRAASGVVISTFQ